MGSENASIVSKVIKSCVGGKKLTVRKFQLFLRGKRVRSGKTRIVMIPAHELAITNGSGYAAKEIYIYGTAEENDWDKTTHFFLPQVLPT